MQGEKKELAEEKERVTKTAQQKAADLAKAQSELKKFHDANKVSVVFSAVMYSSHLQATHLSFLSFRIHLWKIVFSGCILLKVGKKRDIQNFG